MITLYVITAISWGLYAAKVNIIRYGKDAKPFLAFLINAVLCPIAMIFAIVGSKY